MTVLADGTAIPTPPRPTVTAELNRLATELAEVNAAIKTDTSRRAVNRAAWELRDRQRHDARRDIEGRIELLEEWGPVALHHEQALHAYLSRAEEIKARHRSVLTHFSYNIINGHENGSVAHDLGQWLDAIGTLGSALDASTEVPQDLQREYLNREAGEWDRLRKAHLRADSLERHGSSVPFPEFAEELTGVPLVPAWLHFGASRADK